MRIDDNAEALAMMKRALGSLEAKIREAYNKGYRDGVKSMVAERDEPTWEQVKEYCYKRCYEIVDRRWLMKYMYCTNCKTEPQRCPRCGDGVITKGQTTCPICGEPQTEREGE